MYDLVAPVVFGMEKPKLIFMLDISNIFCNMTEIKYDFDFTCNLLQLDVIVY